MTPEAQRIAIAEACGWTLTDRLTGIMKEPDGSFGYPKYYLSDLNAMRQAEITLKPEAFGEYVRWISEITASENCFEVENKFALIMATAAHRAEAFLRTIGKWRDE